MPKDRRFQAQPRRVINGQHCYCDSGNDCLQGLCDNVGGTIQSGRGSIAKV